MLLKSIAKRNFQPPSGSVFDWSHPLARECSLWVSPLCAGGQTVDLSIGADAYTSRASPAGIVQGYSDGGGVALLAKNLSTDFIVTPRAGTRLKWKSTLPFTLLCYWRRIGGGNTYLLNKTAGGFQPTVFLRHRVSAQGNDCTFTCGASPYTDITAGAGAPRQQPYHQVAVHQPNGDMLLYQDGLLKATGNDSTTWDLTTNTQSIGWNNGGNNWNGDFFIFAAWNRSLSAQEVTWLNAEPWLLLKQTASVAYFPSAAVVATLKNRRTLTDLGTRIGSRQMRG